MESLLKESANKPRIPYDSQRHIDSVSKYHTIAAHLQLADEEPRASCEEGEEDAHCDGLGVELLVGCDGGDKGFCYAVDGEEGDIVAVCGEDGGGGGRGPFLAGDEGEKDWGEDRAEGGGEEGDDVVEMEDGG